MLFSEIFDGKARKEKTVKQLAILYRNTIFAR